MNFSSDNVSGVAPEIMAAMEAANRGSATPYGADDLSARVEQRLAHVFEAPVASFLVLTGTAANGLALSALADPFSAIYCHEGAHIHRAEGGAPEFFTGGAKLLPLAGANGKIAAADLAAALDEPRSGPNYMPRAAVSLTQASEAGTLYAPDEIAALAEQARRHGLKVHMDGARFANAVSALNCAPADITWRAGIDVLSLGVTKNGGMGAEAIVFFDLDAAKDFSHRCKRAGHMPSKARFLAAQMLAYLEDARWLNYAAHANRMAGLLADGLAGLAGIQLTYPVEANMVFVELPGPVAEGLLRDGFRFHRREESGQARLVCAFNTRPDDVNRFIACARRHAGSGDG